MKYFLLQCNVINFRIFKFLKYEIFIWNLFLFQIERKKYYWVETSFLCRVYTYQLYLVVCAIVHMKYTCHKSRQCRITCFIHHKVFLIFFNIRYKIFYSIVNDQSKSYKIVSIHAEKKYMVVKLLLLYDYCNCVECNMVIS